MADAKVEAKVPSKGFLMEATDAIALLPQQAAKMFADSLTASGGVVAEAVTNTANKLISGDIQQKVESAAIAAERWATIIAVAQVAAATAAVIGVTLQVYQLNKGSRRPTILPVSANPKRRKRGRKKR
jgi:hypothetical protein